MNLIFQIKQFFVPFPKAGSWAYRFYMWMYDRKIKPIEKDHIGLSMNMSFPTELDRVKFIEASKYIGEIIDSINDAGVSVKELNIRMKEIIDEYKDDGSKIPHYGPDVGDEPDVDVLYRHDPTATEPIDPLSELDESGCIISRPNDFEKPSERYEFEKDDGTGSNIRFRNVEDTK